MQEAINQCVAGIPCSISLPADFDMTSEVTIGGGLTVSISGTKGNGKTVLDANKDNRHFDIDPTSVVSFKEIAFKDGKVDGVYNGGCIKMYIHESGKSGGSLSVLDSTFEGCEAVRNCVVLDIAILMRCCVTLEAWGGILAFKI